MHIKNPINEKKAQNFTIMELTKNRHAPISDGKDFKSMTEPVSLQELQEDLSSFFVTEENNGFLAASEAIYRTTDQKVWLGLHLPSYRLINRWEPISWFSTREVRAINGKELTVFERKFYENSDFCITEADGTEVNELGETRREYSLRYSPFFFGDATASAIYQRIGLEDPSALYGFWPGCFWGDGENYHFRLSPEAENFDSLLFFIFEDDDKSNQIQQFANRFDLYYFWTKEAHIVVIPLECSRGILKRTPYKIAETLRCDLVKWLGAEKRAARKLLEEKQKALEATDPEEETGPTSSETLEAIKFYAREISSVTEHYREDPILNRLTRFNIRMERQGFYFTSTEVKLYRYSDHNASVLKAISYNMRIGSCDTTSEKYRILRAVIALAVDLDIVY